MMPMRSGSNRNHGMPIMAPAASTATVPVARRGVDFGAGVLRGAGRVDGGLAMSQKKRT